MDERLDTIQKSLERIEKLMTPIQNKPEVIKGFGEKFNDDFSEEISEENLKEKYEKNVSSNQPEPE